MFVYSLGKLGILSFYVVVFIAIKQYFTIAIATHNILIRVQRIAIIEQ